MNKKEVPLKGVEIIAKKGSYKASAKTDSFGFYRRRLWAN